MGKEKLATFPEAIKEGFAEEMSFTLSSKTKCLPGRQIERILGRQAFSFYFLLFILNLWSSGFCLHNLFSLSCQLFLRLYILAFFKVSALCHIV